MKNIIRVGEYGVAASKAAQRAADRIPLFVSRGFSWEERSGIADEDLD